MNFTALKSAETGFAQRAKDFTNLTGQGWFRDDERKVSIANGKLRDFQRAFSSQGGLPGREFYKNVVYAPAADNGYSATTLPGATEALKRGDREQAKIEVQKIINAINIAADVLRLDDFKS